MLNELVKYHNEWVSIAFSFLQNKENAEDIVQDMYLLLDKYDISLEKIRYKDSVNKFFIYTTLKNMCLQFIKKQIYTLDINNIHLAEDDNIKEDCYGRLISNIQKEIETWDYYDKTIFEMYMYSGLSYRDIAYGTDKKPRLISNRKWLHKNAVKEGSGISVSSMFNTIKKCKLKLKEKFAEDFEDYFNNDYDKIV